MEQRAPFRTPLKNRTPPASDRFAAHCGPWIETFPGQGGYYSCDAACGPVPHLTNPPEKSAMQQRNLKRNRRPAQAARTGFTLLELLLVLAILVMIIGIGVSNYSGVQTEASVKTTQLRLEDLKKNIQLYQIRMNGLPESLESLRDGPSDAAKKAKWVSPLITEIPLDAWENELVYTVNGNTYEIRSGGVDGQINTDDDITLEGS